MKNQKTAKIGEELAKQFLINKNYSIIKTNVKYWVGEIDIVAKKGQELFFIEVKTRTNLKFGYPETAFNYLKRHHFKQAIQKYIWQTDYQGDWQVDLITIEIFGHQAQLRHYQGVELDD